MENKNNGLIIRAKLNFINENWKQYSFSCVKLNNKTNYDKLLQVLMVMKKNWPDSYQPLMLKEYNGKKYISIQTEQGKFKNLEKGHQYDLTLGLRKNIFTGKDGKEKTSLKLVLSNAVDCGDLSTFSQGEMIELSSLY